MHTKWNDMANSWQDYMQFIKEKRNGLYGATAMVVSNFLIGIPYLCKSSVSSAPQQTTLTDP